MPWVVKHDPAANMVEMICNGPMTGVDLRESTTSCISLGREASSTKFLVDVSGVEIEASMLDLYELPARQYVAEGADRNSRVALIQPTSPAARDAIKFYETVCKNRGWIVQTFTNRQSAVEWLAGDSIVR